MVFSSIIFLYLFLPAVIALYFFSPKKSRNLILLISSLFFYAWGEGFYILVMIASILINYTGGIMINRYRKLLSGRVYLTVVICLNLFILSSFKYTNFIVNNLNCLFSIINIPPIIIAPVHLPIGISFFTFQAISYVVDVYRKESFVQRNFINLGLYISFFPQLIAGPIIRYHNISKQITERFITREDFAYGVRRFLFGFAKKVLIANPLGLAADKVFGLPSTELTTPLAWLGAVCYTLQIYYDFSGYSDMAIGLGRMFGFRFQENFNYPYISGSIREFWRRWHISLSEWFRDYLYIPLGGNRISSIRTHLNLFIVFFLCGLWHGASWNFVLWGLFHGLFLSIERFWGGFRFNVLWLPIRHVYTLLVIITGWVIFRTENLTEATAFLGAMFGSASGTGIVNNVDMFLDPKLKFELFIGLCLSAPIYPFINKLKYKLLKSTGEKLERRIYEVVSFFSFIILILIVYASIINLAAGVYNPFIYFRF